MLLSREYNCRISGYIKNNEEDASNQALPYQQDSIIISRPRREIHMPTWFIDVVAYVLSIIESNVSSFF